MGVFRRRTPREGGGGTNTDQRKKASVADRKGEKLPKGHIQRKGTKKGDPSGGPSG